MSLFSDLVSSYLPVSLPHSGGATGLFIEGSSRAVPMKTRVISSKVHCDTNFASTVESFNFISDEDVSVVFKFPLPTRSAVYKILAKIGDRSIVTEVKPKEEAREEFRMAVSQGHTAVIAQQETSTQIYTLELGNLEAMTEAVVEVHYLRILNSVGGALEYVHTSTWTPPYMGSAGDQARGEKATLDQNPRFAQKVSYKLSYNIWLAAHAGHIRAVECSHPGAVVADVDEQLGGGQRVTLSEEVADPSRDFTLLVDLPRTSQVAPPPGGSIPASCCSSGSGWVTLQECTRPPPGGVGAPIKKTVALATFVPILAADKEESRGLSGAASTQGPSQGHVSTRLEIVFVVDCSGSMQGSRIQQAREAALFFIKDLPEKKGVRFNVVAFGSSHTSWCPGSCEYFPDAMNSAVDWVQQHVHANMGGTEILATFQSIYNTPVHPGYTRQIIFLTDGGITGSEEQAVFDLVAGSMRHGRSPSPTVVLCLGIGHGAHRGLLDGMASRSGGIAQYVLEGEAIARKAGFLKRAALVGLTSPGGAICQPKLVSRSMMVRASPHVLPPRLFPDEPLHILVEVVRSEASGAVLELQGTWQDGRTFSLPLALDKAPRSPGDEYAVLHAMCWVGSLLEGTSPLHVDQDGLPLKPPPSQQTVKDAVVRMACQEGLVTRYTAAVGVILQQNPMDPSQVKKVEVPLAVPHGAVHFGGITTAAEGPAANFSPAPTTGASLFGAPTGASQVFSPCAFTFGQGTSAPTAVPPACFSSYSAPLCAVAPAPLPAFDASPRLFGSAALTSAFQPACAMGNGTWPFGHLSGGQSQFGLRSRAPANDPQAIILEQAGGEAEEEMMQIDLPQDIRGPTEGNWDAKNSTLAPAQSAPSEVVTLLNMCRSIDGSWSMDNHLLVALVSQRLRQEGGTGDKGALAGRLVAEACSARHAQLSESQWTTVLALAFLRKHCSDQRAVWEGMEAKALTWFEQSWPQGLRPVGFIVLEAMKFV